MAEIVEGPAVEIAESGSVESSRVGPLDRARMLTLPCSLTGEKLQFAGMFGTRMGLFKNALLDDLFHGFRPCSRLARVAVGRGGG